jgi:hypothetical protein
MSKTKRTINELFKGLALIFICILTLVSMGYHWAEDDMFIAFANQCEKDGAVHQIIQGETRHIKCEQVDMKRRWIEQ